MIYFTCNDRLVTVIRTQVAPISDRGTQSGLCGSERSAPANRFTRLSASFWPVVAGSDLTAGSVKRQRRPGQPQKWDGVADRFPVKAASYLSARKGDEPEGQIARQLGSAGTEVKPNRESCRFHHRNRFLISTSTIHNRYRYMTYLDKLKDPRWQRKRLEVMERDRWKCVYCDDDKSQLQVHHLAYKGEPWEIDKEWLVTSCERCHTYLERTLKAIRFLVRDRESISIFGKIVGVFRTKPDLVNDCYWAIEELLQSIGNEEVSEEESLFDAFEMLYDKYGQNRSRLIWEVAIRAFSTQNESLIDVAARNTASKLGVDPVEVISEFKKLRKSSPLK